MGTQRNTITINGKVYDTRNGQIIDGVAPARARHASTHGHIAPSSQMSDIIRPTKKPADLSHKNHVSPEQPRPKSKTSHTQINHAKRKLAKAQTLARNYVKKPDQAKPTHAEKPSGPRVIELHKSVNQHRLTRAQKVQRSHNVSKFGRSDVKRVTKKVDHIAVVPAPKTEQHRSRSYDINDTPPVINSHSKTRHRKQSRDLFESALASSKSHHQTYEPKKSHHKKRRWPSIVAGSLTALLLIAFFVYQNIPSIALYTTSSKVGFTVTKPSYQPAGFGLKGPLKYESGKVALDFRSNSDDKNYTIEQTKTELDSASLLNDYLTRTGKDYTTEFANGRTVYIYGNNNATWVDGGIWYNLSNKASLSSDQLLKIVSSI